MNNDLAWEAIRKLIDTVETTGGVYRDGKGFLCPFGDPTWVDIGEAYALACEALGCQPVVDEEFAEDE